MNVRIDHMDGTYRMFALTNAEAANWKAHGANVRDIDYRIWAAYEQLQSHVAVFDALITGWDNEFFAEKDRQASRNDY